MRIFWLSMPWLPRAARAADALSLFYDGGDDAGADGASALADGEAQALVHGDGGDELDLHRHIVARHHHLGALRQLHHPRHVGRAEVELRPIIPEERPGPAPLLPGGNG